MAVNNLQRDKVAERLAHRLKIHQDFLLHPILFKVYLYVGNDIVNDRTVYLRL